MKSILLTLSCLVGFFSNAQTHLIFHKSHIGTKVAFTYLLNHHLLDVDNCGEGVIPEMERVIPIDSVHIILKNTVVNYTNNQIDTIIIAGIGKTKSTKITPKKLSENFGERFHESNSN
jgi:hypothetical protein